jgi:hypothetical protein
MEVNEDTSDILRGRRGPLNLRRVFSLNIGVTLNTTADLYEQFFYIIETCGILQGVGNQDSPNWVLVVYSPAEISSRLA